MKKEQKVVSLTEIKELVQKKGYFKYSRQCKEEGDNSIQSHYSLSSGEVKDIFEDDRLKGIRRSLERVVVFAEDINTSDIDVAAIVSTVENDEPEETNNIDNSEETSNKPFEESIIPSDNIETEEDNQEEFQNEDEFEEQDEEVIIDY